MNNTEFNISEWLNKKPSNSSNSSNPSNPSNLSQELELLTQTIEERAIDIAPSYAEWLNLGFALTDALGESGREYYHRLSRFYPNYSPEETDRKYSDCLKSNGSGITSKTIFHLAKQSGVTIYPINPTPPVETPVSTPVENPDFSPTFSQDIKDNLPGILKKITNMATSPEEADMLVLGALTVFSSCMPNIYGNYDGREIFANIFLFVSAQASAGKGKLSLCRHLVNRIHNKLRMQYIDEMNEYKQLLNEYVIDKKNKQEPQLPTIKTLFIPANNSSTSVYQMLNDNNGCGLMFETEGDTLTISFKADYGNFSDGFRKAFHHEPITYARRKDREFVEIPKPRLSAVLSGTPRQILSLINDTENGLFSRFVFYYMNTRIEWKNVFASKEQTLDNCFITLGDEFYNLYEQLLMLEKPIRFTLSAQQEIKFNYFFEQIQEEYTSIFGIDIIASIRRFGPITFRLAMIMSVLAVNDGCELQPIMVCTDDNFNNAMNIVKILLKHTLKVYEIMPAIENNETQINLTSTKQQFLDKLPDKFNRTIYLSTAGNMNIKQKKADNYIYSLIKSNEIHRIEHDSYLKVKTCQN